MPLSGSDGGGDMNEVIVRIISMPLSVRAFTVPDAQGDYNVYLNGLLSDEQRKKSLVHEKEHIRRGDFFKELPVRVIESTVGGK